MVISTRTWNEASCFLQGAILVDSLQIFDVGEPVTTGVYVTRPKTPSGEPVAALVQTTILAKAVESVTDNVYSVKVADGTPLEAGQAVQVLSCAREPSLVGRVLLIDKISRNGLSIIRKGVASDFETVNQEGKEGL